MTKTPAEVPQDLGSDLLRVAASAPERRALIFPGGSWSYAQLLTSAVSFREELGLAPIPGISRLILELPTGPERIGALYGAWMAGWVVLPVHDDATTEERDRLVSGFSPKGALGPEGFVVLGGAVPPQGTEGATPSPPFPCASALVLSSGTTGAARGVLLGSRQLKTSADGAAHRLDLNQEDVWGLVLSTAHIGGLALVVRAIRLGCGIRLWPKFDAEEVSAALVEGSISHVSLVPVMLGLMVDALRTSGRRPSDRFRCVLAGGAHTSAALREAAREASVPLALTYGMTEACSQVATATPQLGIAKPGTVGSPLPHVEVRIDPSGMETRNTEPGEVGSGGARGEVLVRGETLAFGAVHAGAPWQLTSLVDTGGWFRTGDLGSCDADGHLWIEGRKEGRIITGGFTVDPLEVEGLILTVDGVREVAVVGVPDPTWGEIVVAFVAGENWTSIGGLISDVDAICRQRLTRAKCPSQIVQVETLPRNRNGKVLRRQLAEEFHNAEPGRGRADEP